MRFHFSFVQHWKAWFVVSGLLVLIGLGAFFIRGLNYGIDFTGGTQLDLRFHHAVTATAITNTLDGLHLNGSTVVFLGKGRSNTEITTPNISQGERDQVLATLSSKVGAFTEVSTNRVSSVIGKETEQRALLAVLIAMVAIVLYMTIRFEWRFALAGIAAMAHDVIITVGLIALIHIQLSENFIMAVLTIFGYSITDKIIVFDRIRENLHTQKKNDPIEDLVNTSLNQVVVRSIYTSVTVLIALAALLIFAGSTIRDFSATMFIGVAFGTYSSLFIASPIWMLWHKRQVPQKKPRRRSVELEPEP
jgi:preprotein translocase subunit SecF